MILTTSQTIDGRQITEYLGIVSAAQVMVLGAGNKGVQRGWQTGVDATTEAMKQQSVGLGADAVVAARFEPFGSNICATGTAVRLA